MRETRDRQSDDAVLLNRLQAGDETAVKELAETYSSKIYQLPSGTFGTRRTPKR